MPGLLSKILSFENLSGTFGLEAGKDLLYFRDADIKGHAMSLEGWLKKEDLGKEGRLLLRYGPFAVGLGLGDEGTHVKLQDAIRWYKESPEEPD